MKLEGKSFEQAVVREAYVFDCLREGLGFFICP